MTTPIVPGIARRQRLVSVCIACTTVCVSPCLSNIFASQTPPPRRPLLLKLFPQAGSTMPIGELGEGVVSRWQAGVTPKLLLSLGHLGHLRRGHTAKCTACPTAGSKQQDGDYWYKFHHGAATERPGQERDCEVGRGSKLGEGRLFLKAVCSGRWGRGVNAPLEQAIILLSCSLFLPLPRAPVEGARGTGI